MIEKASVLCAEDGLDDMIGKFINRYSLAMQDTALAKLVAVAVEKCNGIIVLRAPVFLGFFECGHGKPQHNDRTYDAEGETLIQNFHDKAPEAAYTKATREDGDIFPPLPGVKTKIVETRIDPGIKANQTRNPEWFALLLFRIFFRRFTHKLYFGTEKIGRRAKPARQS